MDAANRRSLMSRRSWLLGASATLGGALLTACAGQAPPAAPKATPVSAPATSAAAPVAAQPTAAPKPAAAAPAQAKETALRWSMWAATQPEIDAWQELANDVTAAYPNIKVALETVAFSDYWDKLQTQLASQTEADIVSMQSLRMPPFAVRKALRPLQPFIDKDPAVKFNDFFTTIEDGLSYGGQVYGFAYDLGPILLYYNKDLFDTAGLATPSPTEPMTWQQVREAATKLTKADVSQYGYTIQPNFDASVPWLWSGGGDYMNTEETQCTLDSADSVAALEFAVGMFTKDKIAPPVTDLANANLAREQFYSGKVAMYADGPWNIINVRKNAKFNWDIAPFPAGKAGSVTWVAGSGFGISNTTKYPEESWQALKVITSGESLQKLAKAGRAYPARQSTVGAFKSPDLPPKNVDVVEKILTQQAGKTRFYRTTTTWQETVLMLNRDYNPVFTGQQSVQDTVTNVKPKFDELLKKHQELARR